MKNTPKYSYTNILVTHSDSFIRITECGTKFHFLFAVTFQETNNHNIFWPYAKIVTTVQPKYARSQYLSVNVAPFFRRYAITF